MKKSTKNLVVGFGVSLLVWLIFLIYEFCKRRGVDWNLVLACIVYLSVYLLAGILLNKYGGKD